ncbi:DMT family transporter [Ketogulonicigenium vulgare]|uniref:Putative permease protein n=1 Tax=Ketogulonicigenium vulgare (strain WSH-001) TaxID=759362 RepID=F9Y6J1_KETVW|nr:DMT family transporter [Ketogulonicigenium vulgare]ADO43852.1 S-adenosylmethionine uptake transporter [Ketogulonicigenium vulgare Y25]AEM42111.1 putative permease protein [Ketogulonicigenium vulgare WSH-001]ALJ79738.1 hypothetical protein KVH_00125 [Ketogulonicigenium vulgare]ANW32661.1 hypothetical protein KvSKV_00125 [Ketogulonicigenium vulgare]AOZ55887.1 S-adenosylmethionine uptake transporter [Ketogulonicigenium vulgare]
MYPLHGIALKVLSVLLFLIMASMVKYVSDEIPSGESVFFRSIFAAPVIIIWLMMRGELRTGLKTANPMGHLMRGIIGTSSMMFGFAAIALLPLPEATAIGYAAPLLVVILAAVLLRERVRKFRISAVVMGLAGVLIVLWPSLGAEGGSPIGVTLALCAAFFAALVQIIVRKLVDSESTASIVFWFSISSAALSLLTVPWGWVMPSPFQFTLLVLVGVTGGVAQILMTSAYRYADASLIAPFEYVSMLFALIVGYFIFSEVPTITMLIGAAIIIAAGIMIILRERYLGQQRARQRKATPPV